MLLIWLGATLVACGVVWTAAQAISKGPLSRARRSPTSGATLEPSTRYAAAGFGLKANWPGLVLIAAGVLLLLTRAALSIA